MYYIPDFENQSFKSPHLSNDYNTIEYLEFY